MIPDTPTDDATDTAAPSKTTMRITNLFLDINVALSQYDTKSREAFAPHLESVFQCVGQILQPLGHPVYLLPLTTNEQGIVENVNELGQSLGDPFNGPCFAQMIRIWSLIDEHQRSRDTAPNASSEWEESATNDEDDDEICIDDVTMTILEFVTRTSRQATQQQMATAIAHLELSCVQRMYRALVPGQAEPDIEECCAKLKGAASHNWKWSPDDNDEAGRDDDAVELEGVE